MKAAAVKPAALGVYDSIYATLVKLLPDGATRNDLAELFGVKTEKPKAAIGTALSYLARQGRVKSEERREGSVLQKYWRAVHPLPEKVATPARAAAPRKSPPRSPSLKPTPAAADARCCPMCLRDLTPEEVLQMFDAGLLGFVELEAREEEATAGEGEEE